MVDIVSSSQICMRRADHPRYWFGNAGGLAKISLEVVFQVADKRSLRKRVVEEILLVVQIVDTGGQNPMLIGLVLVLHIHNKVPSKTLVSIGVDVVIGQTRIELL